MNVVSECVLACQGYILKVEPASILIFVLGSVQITPHHTTTAQLAATVHIILLSLTIVAQLSAYYTSPLHVPRRSSDGRCSRPKRHPRSAR